MSLPPGRSSGLLLHPSSLPGPGGIGTVGAEARRLVDWLAQAGQSYWQILPLVPVSEGGSPYSGLSAMAGNPVLIDLEALAGMGLLRPGEARWEGGAQRVHFGELVPWKAERLRRAWQAFRGGAAPMLRQPLRAFAEANASWLDDYALFRALRERYEGAPWTEWEPALRDREPAALRRARGELRDEVDRYTFQQLLFDRQWRALREHARSRGVRVVGDLPIFVSHDSADVWAHRELFRLDPQGRPEVVAGVPPDYFSETGQRWGNPLYRWGVMREQGYRWWTQRFQRVLDWVDVVRVDHFRGFEAFWEVPAEEETAIRGEWRPGPGEAFFHAIEQRLGRLPIIAEDLGLITEAVEELRVALGFPGMRVLQFAWDGDPDNTHLPENHPTNAVAYTGTHDNDTVLGWWRDADTATRARVRPRIDEGRPLHWELMRLVWESPARLAVAPVQDLLGLGSEARMNTPGTAHGNWSWRMPPGVLTAEVAERLHDLSERNGRAARGAAAAFTGEGDS